MRSLATLLLLAFLAPIAPFASAQTIETGDITDGGAGQLEIVKPNIRIQIPGLNEGDLNASGIVAGDGENGCKRGFLCVKSIEMYLNAVYRFALSAGVIIAIVLVMIGGMQWMVGSTVGSNEKARERIEHAIIGLLLLFGTYAILAFINPNITSLQPLELTVIQPPEDGPESIVFTEDVSVQQENIKPFSDLKPETFSNAIEHTTRDGDSYEATSSVNINNIILVQTKNAYMDPDIVQPLLKAANALKNDQGQRLVVTSASRSMRAQISELYNNCYGHACKPLTCNPFKYDPNSPLEGNSYKGFTLKAAYKNDYTTSDAIIDFLTERGEQLTKSNCPHVNGIAVDVWCERESSDDVDPVCHVALEQAMKSNGFCRIYDEGWHFEYKPKAASISAKACDWTIGQVATQMSYCQSTNTYYDPNLYKTVQLGGKSRCMFDYAECTNTDNKRASILGSQRCVAE